MKQVTTKLSEKQIEKIEEKGTTVYKFLQEAVEEKLINDERARTVANDESTTELLLQLIQTVSERLKDIDSEMKDIHGELSKNNDFTKDKLSIIATILSGGQR